MQQLSEILIALTDELMQIREGRHIAVALDGTPLERSEDKDFIYLEAELARDPCMEIDISIHEARAFIRIERSPAGSSSGDERETALKAMVGWVEFVERGFTFRAILDTDGMWTCESAPTVAEVLNRDHSPAGEFSGERWGREELIIAAERLQGLAWLGPGGVPGE